MRKKSRCLKCAVCLVFIMASSCVAHAEEEKGFVIKMWERFKAKKASDKVTPAKQKSPVIPEPVQGEKPSGPPKTVFSRPAVTSVPTTEAEPRKRPAFSFGETDKAKSVISGESTSAAQRVTRPVKPAISRPAVTSVPTTEAESRKRPAFSFGEKDKAKPVVSRESTSAAQRVTGPVKPAISRPADKSTPAVGVAPQKKPAFSFVKEEAAKPAVSAETTTVAQNMAGAVKPGTEPIAVSPEKDEVRIVETNYADENMEWIPEEVQQEGDETTAGEKDEKKPKRPKLSKAQMAETVERRLKIYSQILFMIPELQMKKSESGEEEYYYASEDGIALKLRDLDEKTLRELFNRVNNEATRMNTERLHLQLLQQQQLMRTLQQIPQPPQQPPQPPQVFTPPPQPPQPPRIFNPPPPPPEPPRRQ